MIVRESLSVGERVLVCVLCLKLKETRLGKTRGRHWSTRGAGSPLLGAGPRDTHECGKEPETHAANRGEERGGTVLFFARRVASAPRGALAGGAPRGFLVSRRQLRRKAGELPWWGLMAMEETRGREIFARGEREDFGREIDAQSGSLSLQLQ